MRLLTLFLALVFPLSVAASALDSRVCSNEGSDYDQESPEPTCEDQAYVFGSPYGGSFTIPGWFQANEVFESGACVGHPTDCGTPTYSIPNDIVTEFDEWLDAEGIQTAPLPNVDVVVETDWSGGGMAGTTMVYYPYYDAIVAPSADYVGHEFATMEDLLVHEVGHHILTEQNIDLMSSAASNHVLSGALAEGLADVISSTYRDAQGRAQPWLVAAEVTSAYRDLKQHREINEIHQNASHQDNGRVIGNLFYRMHEYGVDSDALFQLAVDAFTALPAYPSMTDFYNVLLAHAPDPAIVAIVWADMGGNPPQSAGGSVSYSYTIVINTYCGTGVALYPWTFGNWPLCW